MNYVFILQKYCLSHYTKHHKNDRFLYQFYPKNLTLLLIFGLIKFVASQ